MTIPHMANPASAAVQCRNILSRFADRASLLHCPTDSCPKAVIPEPVIVAPVDLVHPTLGTARMADQMQIRQFCLRQHDRHRGYELMFELRRG